MYELEAIEETRYSPLPESYIPNGFCTSIVFLLTTLLILAEYDGVTEVAEVWKFGDAYGSVIVNVPPTIDEEKFAFSSVNVYALFGISYSSLLPIGLNPYTWFVYVGISP